MVGPLEAVGDCKVVLAIVARPELPESFLAGGGSLWSPAEGLLLERVVVRGQPLAPCSGIHPEKAPVFPDVVG